MFRDTHTVGQTVQNHYASGNITFGGGITMLIVAKRNSTIISMYYMFYVACF